MTMPDPMFVQVVDLMKHHSTQDGKLIHDEKETPRGDVGYFATPFDAPAYVRWTRLLTPDKREHTGWTEELDVFTFGVKVFTKIDKSGTLRIFVKHSEDEKPTLLHKVERYRPGHEQTMGVVDSMEERHG